MVIKPLWAPGSSLALPTKRDGRWEPFGFGCAQFEADPSLEHELDGQIPHVQVRR
jgi:hypothetical protein